MSEREIISLCQKWDFGNFGDLYDIYAEQIYKFIYLKTYDKALSEDICSETFFKALDKINTFKNSSESNFKAWLYRIAYNLIVDNHKLRQRIVSIDEILEIGYSDDFAKDVDNKTKLKKVFDFIYTLNKKHKEILIMRLWDDLSYKEISEITWESLVNCKKIVSRTLAKIQWENLFVLIIFLSIL